MMKESHVLSENCQVLQPYQSLHILHRGVNVMSEANKQVDLFVMGVNTI